MPACDRGHLPDDVLAVARLERRRSAKVSVCAAVGAARRSVVEVARRPRRARRSFGIAVLEDPDRPVGVGEAGLVGADRERAAGLLVAGEDRHREVRGPCSSPVFSISSSQVAGLASRWSVGNFAASTSTGKSPSGSSASWRSLSPPQAATPSESSDDAAARGARDPRASGVVRRAGAYGGLLPQSAGNIPPHGARQLAGPIRLTGQIAPGRDGCGWRRADAIEYSLSAGGRVDAGAPEETMVRSVADRAFLPAKIAVRAGREHDDPDRQDDHGDGQAAVPLRRRVHRPVPLRAAALLVPDDDLDVAFGFGAPGPAGRQLPHPVRRPRPPRRLLHPRLGPRVRAVRDRGRRRRRRRHRDHRRPRRPQDPRGARRAAGARRRPDQEPRRAALPGPDADHRADGHLRAALRDRRRHLRRDRLRPAARRLLRHPLQQRLGHRPLGIDPQVHDVRRDHRRSSAPTKG